MCQSRPLFVYFCYFLITISIIQIEKSVDGVLGIQTRGRRKVGSDETMELWRPFIFLIVWWRHYNLLYFDDIIGSNYFSLMISLDVIIIVWWSHRKVLLLLDGVIGGIPFKDGDRSVRSLRHRRRHNFFRHDCMRPGMIQ